MQALLHGSLQYQEGEKYYEWVVLGLQAQKNLRSNSFQDFNIFPEYSNQINYYTHTELLA